MEFNDGVLRIDTFLTSTIAIIVLFVGKGLNGRVRALRDFNVPEPVVGGLLFAILFALVYAAAGIEVEFDLTDRDIWLVYFFSTIGINSRFSDLLSGGRPLAILLTATIVYMFIQNVTGITIASLFGLAPQVGLLGGTVSLIGGHGTAIAWSPTFADRFGIDNAMEIGIACATFGLILASLMGGPIASYLMRKHALKPESAAETLDVGVAFQEEDKVDINHMNLLHALLAIQISVILGYLLNELLAATGFKLPLFVTCLFAGIIISNLVPRLLPRVNWPSRTKAMGVFADIALGMFLAMSLMSMQIWVILDLAGPILTILVAQFLIAATIAVLVIFRIMGKNYDAAVICAGFGGISLGSTATAMANMEAVTKRYGNSHLAFVIVPLVAAFFVDIVNAIMINGFLNHL